MGNEIFYSLDPQEMLALTIYGEAGGEPTEGQIAVANVVLNRAAKGGSQFINPDILAATGSIIHAVCLSPSQFSIYNLNSDGSPQWSGYSNLVTIMGNYAYNAQYNTALAGADSIAELAVTGNLIDNVYGATFYYNPSVASPGWAANMNYVTAIGNHVFYSPNTLVARASNQNYDTSATDGETIGSSTLDTLYSGVQTAEQDVASVFNMNTGATEASIFGGMDNSMIFLLIAASAVAIYLLTD